MTISQEMFRFVTTRRTDRVIMSRIASRLIRDRRATTRNSLLAKLFGPGPFPQKLTAANAFAGNVDFLAADDVTMLLLDPIVAFMRRRLQPQVPLAELAADFRHAFPLLAALLDHAPPAALIESTQRVTARLWDSFYAQTIRGCDRYVSTNYLADGLRVYHVLRLLWMSATLGLERWMGGGFDDYDILIDVKAAQAPQDGKDGKDVVPAGWSLTPQDIDSLKLINERLTRIEAAAHRAGELTRAGATSTLLEDATTKTVFNSEARVLLVAEPALEKLDLAVTSVDEVREHLVKERTYAVIMQETAVSRLADPDGINSLQALLAEALVSQDSEPATMASLSNLVAPAGSFRVPLTVGEIRPPGVGDLLLVEQELRSYKLGEVAEIECIMRGERRERTIRKLNRTTETTSTESTFEQEETSSLKTDERFQLSTQAQQAAEQSSSVQAGVNISGKFGPVQVGASVNASFDTSKSSSQTTSQEYAKTVTEEATKRVMSSIKQSSSVTVLTESTDTTLRGFNNEKGSEHINGIYRWVDKIYDAKLLNYGRRLMHSLQVPEPAAFYRGLMQQSETEAISAIDEPLHPALIGRGSCEPLEDPDSGGGFRSFRDINDSNYAKLAALYDASVSPPPLQYLTVSKAFVHPDAMQAKEMEEHTPLGGGNAKDLSYVSADNTLTVDPGYRITDLVVFAPKGAAGAFGDYADALKLGEDGKEVEDQNIILVQVANRNFYLTARENDDGGKTIDSNFNTWVQISNEGDSFGSLIQPSLPVSITANFEGMLTFTVIYKAIRTDENFDAWKASTYAAIIQAYTGKRRDYEQSLTVAESQAQGVTEQRTLNLRDDQYRSIELTELKRGCIDLMTEGTAIGRTSIVVSENGTPKTIYDPVVGATIPHWRSPLANGSVAEFFEVAFEWENTTYQFHPYYWTDKKRWGDLSQFEGADPVFEQFLRAGSASVVVPVRPGFERSVIFFLKTGLVWGGGYLALFNSQDMLDVYADVELGQQFDPPLQVGESWEVRLPTSMVMLQEGDGLPEFPDEETVEAPLVEEPVPDESVPY